jgi:hypothetical protein
LFHEKYQVVDTLEVYITEVERQLDRKVKIVSQIEVVSIMEGMMDWVNALAHLLNSLKNMAFVDNTLCQVRLSRMV